MLLFGFAATVNLLKQRLCATPYAPRRERANRFITPFARCSLSFCGSYLPFTHSYLPFYGSYRSFNRSYLPFYRSYQSFYRSYAPFYGSYHSFNRSYAPFYRSYRSFNRSYVPFYLPTCRSMAASRRAVAASVRAGPVQSDGFRSGRNAPLQPILLPVN